MRLIFFTIVLVKIVFFEAILMERSEGERKIESPQSCGFAPVYNQALDI